MDEQNMEKIMYTYAKSTQSQKNQDLSKFMAKETTVHHSTAPVKRWIICISLCVLLIAAFCVSGYLSRQPNPPLWDLAITEFASFHAGKWGVPADQTQTLTGCIAKNEPTATLMKNTILPTLPCRDITAYWFHRRNENNSLVGIAATLESANGPVSKLDVYYLFDSIDSNQEILHEFGFTDLQHTTKWKDLDMSYSKFLTEQDGIVYKIYFEANNLLCAADIYSPADKEITDILTAVFG